MLEKKRSTSWKVYCRLTLLTLFTFQSSAAGHCIEWITLNNLRAIPPRKPLTVIEMETQLKNMRELAKEDLEIGLLWATPESRNAVARFSTVHLSERTLIIRTGNGQLLPAIVLLKQYDDNDYLLYAQVDSQKELLIKSPHARIFSDTACDSYITNSTAIAGLYDFLCTEIHGFNIEPFTFPLMERVFKGVLHIDPTQPRAYSSISMGYMGAVCSKHTRTSDSPPTLHKVKRRRLRRPARSGDAPSTGAHQIPYRPQMSLP